MTDTTTTLDAVTSPIAPPESPFRWRLANRPDVRFGHAIGGVAGILVAAAFFAAVVAVTDGDNPTVAGVGFHAGLIALALLAGWKIRGPVRSAAVAALALAVPLLWAFAVFGDDAGDGRGDFRIFLLLTVASYAVLYLLTWTRGRAVLLGLALLFAAGWIVFEVASQRTPFAIDAAGEAQSGGIGNPNALLTSGDRVTQTGIAQLGVAVVLLGAGILLDRRRRAGAATPCLLVGGIYGVYAALTLGADADNVYALGGFVVVAGLAIGLAGSLGRRRGTSWLGALVALAGAVTMIVKGTTDTADGGRDSAWGFAGYALLGAAILLVAGVLIARGLHEPLDGGEPAPPPPPAPPAAAAPDEEPPAAPDADPAAVAVDAPAPEPAPEPPAPPAAPEAAVTWTAEPAPGATGGGCAEPPPESNDGA